MTDLLDINVWVGLSVEEHALHPKSLAYFREEAAPHLAFCRVSALGLVRVSMNKNTFGGVPLTLTEAWRVYRGWQSYPAVTIIEEPDGIEALLDQWVMNSVFPPKLWTDAYLAAFAVSAGLRLVTFDKDFERFPGLDLLRL